MKLKEFLSNISTDELTEKLILLDKSIMELHQNGYFVVGDLSEIEIINDEITLASFKNKVDYLNSGYNENGDKRDILAMCAIGICAYNKFSVFYTNREFIGYLIDNLEMYFENGKVPKAMQEYYIDVLARGNVDYLNNFMLKNDNSSGKNNSRVYSKSTAIGRAFSDRENAYTNVLLLPAIIVLVIITILVVYMLFYR